MPKPFDAASKHLIEARPRDWLELAGFPVPSSEDDLSIVVIHRRFNVHVGKCLCCKLRVQGRHPLQTSDALGAAAARSAPMRRRWRCC